MDTTDERCTIGIDCAPGDPRPDSYFPKVLKGTGLRVCDFKEPDTFFGAWEWHLLDAAEKRTIFLVNRSLFHRRLAGLVRKGAIRGALLEPQGLCLVLPTSADQRAVAAR